MLIRRVNDGAKMAKSEYSRRASVGVRPALAAVVTGFAALSFSAPLQAEEPASMPQDHSFMARAFDQMKAVEGTWQVVDLKDPPCASGSTQQLAAKRWLNRGTCKADRML